MTRTTTTTILILLIAGMAQASKPIRSTIDRVTVFLNGAQVTRQFDASLTKGTQTVSIQELSPYIDPRTIQVKGAGSFTILSIRHQMNYLNEKELEGDLRTISDSILYYREKNQRVQLEVNALNESERFLQHNRQVFGSDGLDHQTMVQSHKYFFDEILKINRRRYELQLKTQRYNKLIARFQRQLNALNSKLVSTTSEIIFEIDSDEALKGEFEVSYLVNNAGWFPSYDIRVEDISSPLELVYKANVQQNTGVDWKDVTLTFSNANPYQSGDLPVLRPYYLNYTRANYNANQYASAGNQNSYNLKNYISNSGQEASGRITDRNGNPVSFATIKIKGTSIGTFTDASGYFSVVLPQGRNQALVQAMGYNDQYANLSGSANNQVVLSASHAELNAVTITAEDVDEVFENYSIEEREISKLPARSLGVIAAMGGSRYKDKNITVMPLENQTTIEITLDRKFTVNSTGKQKLISMNTVEIPAYYEHRSVPKLEKAAFLIARISDWSAYNLLEGEANLYFENTYIGKSILDVRYLTDTLNISLGRDRNVLVNRQKVRSQSTREFIGRENIEKRAYEIEVRNNKKQEINLIVYDQIPISQRPKDIEVILRDKGGAIHTERTGELRWEYRIKPGETKKMDFKYQVKFPKDQTVNLE